MKRTLPISIAVACVSFAITWLLVGDLKPLDLENPTPSAPPSRLVVDDHLAVKKNEWTHFSVKNRSSDEYRAAWLDVASLRLSKRDRKSVQVELLNAWAEVDLEAAIEAALELPWGSDGIPFMAVLLDRSEDVWKLIKDERLGPLESAMLLNSWSNVLGCDDPKLFLGYMPELKGIQLRNALQSVVQQLDKKEDAREIWRALANRKDLNPDDRRLLGDVIGQLGGFLEEGDLRQMMQSNNESEATAAAQALVAQLQGKGDTIDFHSEIDSAPDHLKSAMATAMISSSYPSSGESTLAALNHLVADEQWNALAPAEVSSKIGRLADSMGKSELAEWVAELPPREETTEIFHRGVEPFIQEDREASWEWINGLEQGIWRDRAFAEYSQQMLNRFNDPDASRQALDQIQDTDFRATATSWRANWEERYGK